MLTVEQGADGLRVIARAYRLWFRPDRPLAILDDAGGKRWGELATTASVGSSLGLDDTAALEPPRVRESDAGVEVTVAARSSTWETRTTTFACRDDHLAIRVEVEGQGSLTDVHLLGGFVSASARWGSGFQASGAGFRSVVSPDPSAPDRHVGPASEPASIDVLGGSLPGRGHWFFTPPPLCFALHRSVVASPTAVGGWLSMGLAGPVETLTFTGFHFEPGERAFSLRLAYEGQTRVEGRWASPSLVMTFDEPDAYAAIGSHAALLGRLGAGPAAAMGSPAPPARRPAAWWREPIFSGWGAQCHLAGAGGAREAGLLRPADLSRQDAYDGFLADLARAGIDPGTIVIDDRWEDAYGSGLADPDRWPDLRGWIAQRHAEGRRVLLWWRAWAPDAVDPGLCVRNAAGRAVAVDPTNERYVDHLVRAMARMLGPSGYDADGLKVDFTAMTPSGPGMSRAGPAWGIALLHRLLAVIHDGAVAAKPDALVITHAPHPAFRGVTDMVRLNDVLRLDDPTPGADIVGHMAHRAAIVRAAMPDVLIDTDGWAMLDRATWRRYLERQPELGVPALYYTTHIDRSGEALGPEDHAALHASWDDYRKRRS